MKAIRTALLISTVSGLLSATPAWAETADQPAEGEIIVTAQRRGESLNQVPMAVQAVTSETLKDLRVTDVRDLSSVAPSFTVSQSYQGVPTYTLRGIGFNTINLSATSTVGTYVDEVSYAYPIMNTGPMMDLERVEVLKGPQGLLFGSNSTGGAVNYVAARPTDTLSAGLDASYGRFDAWELGGFVSGPLADGVGLRVAAQHQGSGEWQRSATRANDRNGKRNFTQVRALLDVAAGERLTVKLAANAFWDKSDVQAAQLIQVNPLIPPFVNPLLLTQPIVGRDARVGDWTIGTDPKRDDRQWHLTGRIDYELSDAITVTSLTSYADYRQNDLVDPDGTAMVLADTRDQGTIKAFFQELRLSGEFGGGSRWIVGANYENNKVREVQTLRTTQNSGFAPFELFFGLPVPNDIDLTSDQKFKNYSAFANLDLAVSDVITLHGGLRYTDTSDAFTGCTGNSANGSLAIGLGILSQGNPFALGPNPVCTQLDANLKPTITRNTLAEDNVSWRVGVDYQPSSDTLVYANVSRGYKIGAFPLIPASSTSQYTPVSQEKLTAYEAGFKLSLMDRKVQLNGAVFHYDYRDKQALGSVILTPNIFGPLNLLVNIPKSKVTGAELQAVVRPVRGLTLNAGVTYVDSEIGNFTNFDPFGVVRNFQGEAFPNTPKWQWTASADYEFAVTDALKAFVGANASGRSATNGALGRNAILGIDGYTLLDLRAGIGAVGDRWKLSVWGRNVTDKYYWTNAYKIADVSARFAGMPATYGASLSFRY